MNGGRTDGFTLIELLVVITITGISFGVVAFSWPEALSPSGARTSLSSTEPLQPAAAIRSARTRAIREGRVVTAVLAHPGGGYGLVTALPDGRVAGAARFGHDEISGQPLVAR